jgi:uncharacterized protein (TIGR03435 family)
MRRTIVVPFGVSILTAGLVCSQPPPKRPAFEVASVRLGQPAAGDAVFCEGGRLTVYNYTLRTLIQMAWHVRDIQVLGGPAWMDSQAYYIAAKGDPSATDDQCRAMLQTLLEERFALVLHHDLRDLPVYALVLVPNGPKFHESEVGVPPNIATAKGSLSVQKVSMANVARVLSSTLDRPVLDKTGLGGRYTFRLEWDADENQPTAAGDVHIPNLNTSLFRAIETQLGLRLEVQKGPVDVMVIDHADRPSPN